MRSHMRSIVAAWGWKVASRIRQALLESVEYSMPHLPALGLVGVIGFPLYYWIWADYYPQPYESLPLRLLGALLFLGLTLASRWPRSLRPLLPWYWFASFLYALPFFFTYMLLQNGGSTVWAMSTMAGLMLLILIGHDWVLVIVMFLIGSMLAVGAFAMTSADTAHYGAYFAQLPIYVFVVIAGSVFNYNAARLKQERSRLLALASVGANIAHELRTPLLTIKTSANGLSRYMPRLLAGYNKAAENDIVESAIPEDRLWALDRALRRIDTEVNNANVIIDMLLLNLARPKVDTRAFALCWIADAVNVSLQRYPFRSVLERSKVRVDTAQNFQFWGSEQLMVHIIFNLLKNALQSIDKRGKGDICISLERRDRANRLLFEDTGSGIPAKEIPYIFESFYSSKRTGGAGVGLAFCRQVMEYFNGRISCTSVQGEYMRFILDFPRVAEQPAVGDGDGMSWRPGTEQPSE